MLLLGWKGILGTFPNHRIREAVKGEGILVEGQRGDLSIPQDTVEWVCVHI